MLALLSTPLFRARRRRGTVLLSLLALLGCNGTTSPEGEVDAQVRLQEIASGLESPVYLTAPASDPRLFIVEQPGRIRIVRNGSLLATPFLDIRDRVGSGGERGLLSMAFHPQYAANGFFYVNYTDRGGDTRIERYRVGSDPDLADPASARLLLAVEQPYANHNGGLIKFGPDGMLYVGMGDGGSGGDPQGHGQNRGTLLGALLRIDVNRGDPYAIPPGNPFVGQSGARGEIWAYGLRNPWRFSFDRQTGQLYLADVGQDAIEEVNVVGGSEAGLNYGWSVMEGSQCYGASSCSPQGMVLPVIEYGTRSEGCAVTGGYVYRGSAIPAIAGHYFYGDYCRGWIRSFRYANGEATQQRSWELGGVGNVLSFGEDAAGELYLLSANGRVYQLRPDAGS
ncbi:MAG: PQQ-dependent sugar dehydrogenase [Gemmatimonadota bacterium]|nr:PQQ-dependent sugar dehydrogenase [Gemmatimonadota bacterium]